MNEQKNNCRKGKGSDEKKCKKNSACNNIAKIGFEQCSVVKLSAGDNISEVCKLESELISPTSEEKICEAIDSRHLSYFALKFEGKIIGFFECLLLPPEAELYTIVISKSYQKLGLGSGLMAYFENLAKNLGCETIFLEVNKINQAAISLYTKFGYEKYGQRTNYYGDNDAILMKKQI